MRQTLHLVTRRDYALLRAALSETNFPAESSLAKRLAPSVRALAAAGPMTTADALAHLERKHGLKGMDGRRAWRAARVRAHLLHHHETALGRARPEGRFVALEEPEQHVPDEARAEILRRYLAAFGPASRRDIGAWSMMHVPELEGRSSCWSRCAVSATRRGASCSTYSVRRCRPPISGARAVPAEVGQRVARGSQTGRACCRSSTGRRSSR